MEVIPEAPEDVREAARFAFWETQLPLDDGKSMSRARERVRNVKSQRGIDGLKPEHGGGLWEARQHFDGEFANLPFQEKKRIFMSGREQDQVPWLGIPADQGRPSYVAFHAAGLPLIAWRRKQGRRVTANLGRGDTQALNPRKPQPCGTVRFLAAEFHLIAEWYGKSEWVVSPAGEVVNPEAPERLRIWLASVQNIAFDVAQQHIENRTALK